jgi:hypothetical protein
MLFAEFIESVFDKYHTKLLLGDFSANVGREDLFKPTLGIASLHEISNDNSVIVLNFATSKNPSQKCDRNIHKYK